MKTFEEYSEKSNIDDVYLTINNDFGDKISKLVDYEIVDIISKIPNTEWTIQGRLDENKIDETEEWVESFEDLFVTIYKEQGKYGHMTDTQLSHIISDSLNLSDYLTDDIFYTVTANQEWYSHDNPKQPIQRLYNYIKDKIENIQFLKQNDTPFNKKMVVSFRVRN